MPFTFSHPAIILPIRKLKEDSFSLTGLVVGSIAPDFEYFIRMNLKGIYGHTLLGLFYFDLPIGLILAFLFHDLIKTPLLRNSPSFFKSRFTPLNFFHWDNYFLKHYWIIFYSILIGSLSHILWDSFTHRTGFFVENIPILLDSLTVYHYKIPYYELLQHISSFLGVLFIFSHIYKLPLIYSDNKNISIPYWLTNFLITVFIILLRYFLSGFKLSFGNLVITIVSASLISLCLSSFFFKKGI